VITVGGTSKLIDRIESSGHCRRRPNPEDGRSSVIELTASGRRLLDKATQAVDDELTVRLGDVLTPRMLQQFAAVRVALAGYNAGPARVAACMCVPAIAETQGYVARILGLMGGAGDVSGGWLAVRLVA